MTDPKPWPLGPHPGGEITPDARSLRGLAHPLRMRLLGLLRIEGPSTATRLGERLGQSSGATSYHLRQLATHGFVVEDESRGAGRERWWKAAHQVTNVKREQLRDPEMAEAAGGFLRGLVPFLADEMNRAIHELPMLPAEWREASTFTDVQLQLTAEELRHFVAEFRELIARYRLGGPELAASAPPDSAPVAVQLQAFPRPGSFLAES